MFLGVFAVFLAHNSKQVFLCYFYLHHQYIYQCAAGLDMHCRLTEPLGMRIAEFPLNPMFAKMLLESGRWGKNRIFFIVL